MGKLIDQTDGRVVGRGETSEDMAVLAAIYDRHGLRKLMRAVDSLAKKRKESLVIHIGQPAHHASDAVTRGFAKKYAEILYLIGFAEAWECPVCIMYEKQGETEPQKRVVDHPRLLDDGGVQYLTGYCRDKQEYRKFRLDRIRAIKVVKDENGG